MSMFQGLLTLNALVSDLQSTARGIASDALVDRGAGWIKQLEVEFPLAHRLLMSALYKEPEDVLNALIQLDSDLRPLRGNAGALAYIAAIQAKIRGGAKP